jgi:hypothetical protein
MAIFDRAAEVFGTHSGRMGQYRKGTFVSKFGPDIVLPDLLHKIADCPHHDPMRGGCLVHYDFSED